MTTPSDEIVLGRLNKSIACGDVVRLRDLENSQLTSLLSSAIQEERKSLVRDLREYHEKVPDADYQDIVGYISGKLLSSFEEE